jgi:transcriptional regulator with XRE-family HTH domain
VKLSRNQTGTRSFADSLSRRYKLSFLCAKTTILTLYSALKQTAGMEAFRHRKMNELGELLRTGRTTLGLTQQAVAESAGVGPSYVSLLERGRRKPSLNVAVRIADTIGVERDRFLLLAFPEARALLPCHELSKQASQSWNRFVRERAILRRYQVTKNELQILQQLSLHVTTLSTKEFIAILTLLRNIPDRKCLARHQAVRPR